MKDEGLVIQLPVKVQDKIASVIKLEINGKLWKKIEAPRSKLRGIFDPQLVFLFFMLTNPVASHGECARGDSIINNKINTHEKINY